VVSNFRAARQKITFKIPLLHPHYLGILSVGRRGRGNFVSSIFTWLYTNIVVRFNGRSSTSAKRLFFIDTQPDNISVSKRTIVEYLFNITCTGLRRIPGCMRCKASPMCCLRLPIGLNSFCQDSTGPGEKNTPKCHRVIIEKNDGRLSKPIDLQLSYQ